MSISEYAIEGRCCRELKKAGWFITKLMKTSTNGIPDRLCIKNGRVVFIEFKIPGVGPSLLQEYVMNKLIEQGMEVIVASSLSDVKHLIK